MRGGRSGLAALALALAFARGAASAASADIATLDADARAGGDRKLLAIAIGEALFARPLPAQVLHVRVDGAGRHAVALLLVSAVKFHRPLDRAAFDAEIAEIVRASFAAAPVEEVDVQVQEPVPVGEHAVVTGDFATPTVRIVYTVTVRRAELAGLAERLARADDVYVAPSFAARLERRA